MRGLFSLCREQPGSAGIVPSGATLNPGGWVGGKILHFPAFLWTVLMCILYTSECFHQNWAPIARVGVCLLTHHPLAFLPLLCPPLSPKSWFLRSNPKYTTYPQVFVSGLASERTQTKTGKRGSVDRDPEIPLGIHTIKHYKNII